MRNLGAKPTRVQQVYEAILNEITEGRLPPNARLVQEELAAGLGVSRQPVQQALMLLRKDGILIEASGRGLVVAPLEAETIRNIYDVRAVMDGLAARRATEAGRDGARADGPALIAAGREAVATGLIARMIEADMEFHFFLYELSGNPLIAEVCAPHWSLLRRVMGEVLMRGETPNEIWDQHEAILAAVTAGNANLAEGLSVRHIKIAGDTLVAHLDGVARPAERVPASAGIGNKR